MTSNYDGTSSSSSTTLRRPLVVEVSSSTDASRVRLLGELDLLTSDEVTGTISRLVAHGYRSVTIDLSGLRFLDVVGVNTLLRAHRQLEHAGGRLTLSGCRPFHLRLLAIAELDRVLHVDDDRTGRSSPQG